MLHSANLYQIYTYVKNEDKSGSRKVGGLLLYARTTEEMSPFLSVVMGGNQIGVQSLDLNYSYGRRYSFDQLFQIMTAPGKEWLPEKGHRSSG